MESEVTLYVRLLRKWFWLPLLAAFVAGGVGFIIRTGQPATYQASALISIGGFMEAPNPEFSQIQTSVKLAQTYIELVKTQHVLQSTIEALNLPLTVDELRNTVDTNILRDTSLLRVSATHPDPVVASEIANGIAEQLILNSPTNLTPEQQNQIDLANEQIATLNIQLQESRTQLQSVNEQIENTNDPDEIERLTTQRNAITDQINVASSTIAQFSSTITSLQQRTNSLNIIEQAFIPTEPSGPGVWSITILSALLGAAFASGIVLLIEYMDDIVRTPEIAIQTLALPVLGTIVHYGNSKDKYLHRLITNQPLQSQVAEEYRALRTNLLYTNADAKKVYVITSPGPGDGKTTTTVNLAVALATAGLRVLLIDGDLRRPKIHEFFDLENNVGLSTLLFGEPLEANNNHNGAATAQLSLTHCLRETSIPNLRVITSGFIPKNPAELFGSALMKRWIKTFQDASNIDIVLIDTPPCLLFAESAILAATASADVVLVIDAKKTQRRAALRVKENFTAIGVNIRGIVLNKVHPRDNEHNYGNAYSYYYTNSLETNGTKLLQQFGSKKENND